MNELVINVSLPVVVAAAEEEEVEEVVEVAAIKDTDELAE